MQPTDTLTTFLNLDLKHRLSVNDSKPHHNGQVKLVDFPFTAIAFLAHKGCPTAMLHTVSRFIQWRRENGPSTKINKTFNILYDDPHSVASETYRFDVGASIVSTVKFNQYDVQQGEIEGGRCAVLRHIGNDSKLGDSIGYLYRDWLCKADVVLRNAPLFIERVQDFPDVTEESSIIDSYLPIA